MAQDCFYPTITANGKPQILLQSVGAVGVGHPGSPLEDLASAFLRAQDVTLGSQQTYTRSLRQLLQWLERCGIKRPNAEDLLAYKRSLEARGVSALTISGYLVVVRKFFAWLAEHHGYPNVAKTLRGAKSPHGFRKDPLTPTQATALLASINCSTVQGQRDFALVNLLLRTGLRTIEVVRANVGDIRQTDRQTVLWVQGKGRQSKDEFVVLTPAALNPLRKYLDTRQPVKMDESLFASVSDRNPHQRLTTRSVSRIVKTYLKASGLEDQRATAHSLRHTAVTLALKGGATIQEAQALARHANINTTLLYAHNLDRLNHLPERCIDRLLATARSNGRTRSMTAMYQLRT